MAFCFNEVRPPVEVVLWSGGLDSLVGLYSRLFANPSMNYTLLATGSNDIMNNVQHRIFNRLATQEKIAHHLKFIHIPIRLDDTKELPKNSNSRARGLVFLLMGAACALLEGQNSLSIYENGVGAINLPLPAGVGRDHSKAVNPISLLRVGNFVSKVIDASFQFQNPFLFVTKAQMYLSLKENPDLIAETISCDHLHRANPMQCGYCSSCLLRRQSLAAANIKDYTKYLVPHGRNVEHRDLVYFHYMSTQVEILDSSLNCPDSWRCLSKSYGDLPDIVDWISNSCKESRNELIKNLLGLYRTYVLEWENVRSLVKEQLITKMNHQKPQEEEAWQTISWIPLIPKN
jgi:7-cyano-7-deazaguanine synthase in queuosine biosynthesis